MKRILSRKDVKETFKIGDDGIPTVGCVGMDISCFDLDDDFSLAGFDVQVINVLYPDCRVRVAIGNGNFINIVGLPMWVSRALFEARMQGQHECIGLLSKFTSEIQMNKDGIPIPYANTVSW